MRAVIYCRISDDRTGEAAGVRRQEQDARALAERNGWEVAEVVIDNDVSASRYTRRQRPGYQRVVAMAGAGEVEVIAAYHVDRLYRRPAELEDLIDLAEAVLIATCEGEFRLDTSDGRAMARVIAAMAAKSSDDASRRLRRKHLELAEEGRPGGGGRRPFGFEADRVTVRPDEAALIRSAAARVIAGDSLGAIVREWTAAGVPTVTGGRWETTAIRRIIEAPRVAGLRALKGQVVGDAVWPAILDRPTWDAARSALAGSRSWGAPSARSYLLSGLIRCEACDLAMTAAPISARGYRYRRYACLTRRGGCNRCGVSAPRSEEWVVGHLLERLTRTGDIDPPLPPDRGDVLSVQVSTAEGDLAALAEDLAAGRIGRASFVAASAALEARIVGLRRQLIRERSSGEVEALAASADPAVEWERLGFDRQRGVLVQSIDRVMVAMAAPGATSFDGRRLTILWS